MKDVRESTLRIDHGLHPILPSAIKIHTGDFREKSDTPGTARPAAGIQHH